MPVSNNIKQKEAYTTTLLHRGPDTIRGLIAGGIVGCSELLISYPFELAKTQLQLDHEGRPGRFTGFADVIQRTFKKKGFLSLYKGMGIVMFFKTPQESIRFGVYEQLKSTYKDELGYLSPGKLFLCGTGAGVSEAILAVTPMETVKVKLIHDQQSDKPRYKGFFLKAIFKMIKTEGIQSVYKGLFPTILRQGSNHGIRFFSVETMKRRYCTWKSSEKVPSPVIGIFGVFAGLISVLLNNPIDVVKTRMQGLHGKEYKNTFYCFRKIYKEEGYFAFYKGTKARCLRVGIDAGYTFMCYDIVMNILATLFDNE